ncbi:MAG: hypothetical protein ABJF11_12270 [Reichenbachiella sp.]|uniref:hypothetical protein n=1 Tax=Reichenbachiella sp. TaxID=2184521 RepID=UPI0032677EC3
MLKKTIIILANLIAVGLLLSRSLSVGGDKGHIIVMFYFPILAIANYWIGRYHPNEKKTFKWMMVLMAILYVPAILYVANY